MRARKIPRIWILLALPHFFANWIAQASAQTADTATLFREARKAEIDFEASVRRYAPTRFRNAGGQGCDEIVGRFCLYFDDDEDTLPREPAEVAAARDTAIARLQRALAAAPHRTTAAFPLVRYLVQADRIPDAESAARTFAQATTDTTTGHMLLGFALHHARNTPAALAELQAWLSRLSEKERRHITSMSWLQESRERNRLRRAGETVAARYETRAWRFADPLYLTPGNELLADHLARHALARMLEKRPNIVNLEAWGDDVEQLTVRFGAPARTTRSWRTGSMGTTYDYSEHWDPSQRPYFAPSLDSALHARVAIDTIWPLDSMTTRSGHAPPTIRLMRVLQHQAALFGDSLRSFVVYGRARTDSLTGAAALEGRLFALDSMLQVVAEAAAVVDAAGDSAVFRGELPLPHAARFYSAEVYDRRSRYAARARYRVAAPHASGVLRLSSLIFAEPFAPAQLPENHDSPRLRPLTRPIVSGGSKVGIYAETAIESAEARTLLVELENRRLDGRSAVGKAVGWIGEKLGLGSTRTPTRLGWSVEVRPGRPHALPVTLDLAPLAPGRYMITLMVRDPESGSRVVANREILVLSAAKASSSDPR